MVKSGDYKQVCIFMMPFGELPLLWKIGKDKELVYFDLYFSMIHRRIIKLIFTMFMFDKVVTFSPRIKRSYFFLQKKVFYSMPLIPEKFLEINKILALHKNQILDKIFLS